MQNGHFRLAKGALWQGGWTKLLTSLQKKNSLPAAFCEKEVLLQETSKRTMKRILLILTAVLSFGSLLAQPNDGMYRYSLDFTLSQKDFVDTIPILVKDEQIYIPVTINGRQHLMNFDTGSSQGVAYEGVSWPYGEPIGKVDSRDANGKRDTIEVVRFPDFNMGSLTISNYKGSLLQRMDGNYTDEGIIGFDLLNKGLLMKIDMRAKHLIVTDRPKFFDHESGYIVKYKLRRFVPFININTFLSHQEPVMLDLGAQDLFSMNKQNFDRERFKDARVAQLVEETTTGQSAIGNFGAEKENLIFYLHFPKISWGKLSLLDVHAMTTQGDSKIGAQLLQYGTLTIDGRRKKLKFMPFNTSDSILINNTLDDITYVPLHGRAVVGTIRHTSKQYKNGFRQGDIILKINGDSIDSFADFQNYHFVKDYKYVFTLRSLRGFNKEVIVEHWGEK